MENIHVGQDRQADEAAVVQVASTAPWPSRVAIVGAGYMGRGIGQVLALAGCECVLADVSPEAGVAGLNAMMLDAGRHERDGLVPPGSTAQLQQLVNSAGSIEEAVAEADYVVEAVYEDTAVKSDVLRRIEDAASPNAIISTNTSTISMASLSQNLEYRRRFLGAHWFNPPQFVPAVEVIAGPETAPESLETVEGLLIRAGKKPARTADRAGFVANRLQYALFQEAAAVVEEGIATPEAVDLIVRTSFGFRLPFFGPFAIADMAGLDVYRACYRVFEESFGDRFAPPALLERLVSLGHLGSKTGSGFVVADPVQAAAMAERRDRAYVELGRLLDRLEHPESAEG